MQLEVLPDRSGGAAENMALDFLLLQRYPNSAWPRFRHYGWYGPAVTFGYAQKIEFVRGAVATMGSVDLCRRPTGGGIVDHRDDWTYALVIPRGHPLEDARAVQSYREVHECLAAALCLQKVPAVTKQTSDPLAAMGAGVCFNRAELYDVVHARSGEKIAGAAQKRNRHGLLFQGSIWRPAVGGLVDWNRFQQDFVTRLAAMLQCHAAATPWPDLDETEVSGLMEQYSSREWIESR